ncbi:hypothetical protein ACFL0M_15135 [Thermodesulfobacteriota bacterium]
MGRLIERAKTVGNIPIAYLKMLFSRDFWKIQAVCLKMLFRKSTRKRFVCLVIAFLFMMGFNTCSYVMKFHKTEKLKKVVLDEQAFKVFFVRVRTPKNFQQFLAKHHGRLQDHGAEIVKKAFIYQNNLYINFLAPSALKTDLQIDENGAMDLLYGVFNLVEAVRDFYVSDNGDGYQSRVKSTYIDHNGARLNEDIIQSRHNTLKGDLIDIAEMMRAKVSDKRIDVINAAIGTIVDNLKRVSLNQKYEPNLYLSRIEAIVPMNFLHILTHIQQDNTTDIMDLLESVKYARDATIETDTAYLQVPDRYTDQVMYNDIDIYPRYIPIYIPDLLKSQWNWLLYQNIDIKTDFMNYIERLHFKGHYLFSYEKSHIIQDKVKNINDDIRSNHIHFYLTDLSMGIAFPFMMSLFAFIHLKTEIAFLLMYKNRIKEVLFIFWLLPIGLILLVKSGVLTVYLFYLFLSGFGLSANMVLPLSISFLAAAAAFYPINKWCFSQFTGDTLNLYTLHKGR